MLRRAAVWLKSGAARLAQNPDRLLRLADTTPCLVATGALAVLSLLFPVSLPNWLSLSPYSAVWLLAGLSAVAAAALTVLYALYVFRSQYLLARLPVALAGPLLADRSHRAAFVRLLAALITSLVALGPITGDTIAASTANAATLCIALLAFSLARLPRDARRLFAGGYSEAMVSLSMSALPQTYFAHMDPAVAGASPAHLAGVRTREADPFALMEQVLMRCLRDGDYPTCARLLRKIAARVWAHLDSGPVPNARNVLAWLGELLRVIGSRALAYDAHITDLAVWIASDTTVHTYELGLSWDTRIEYTRALAALRRTCIRERSRAAIAAFNRMASVCFREAIRRAPEERLIASLISSQHVASQAADTDAFLEWNDIFDVGPNQIADTMRLCAECSLPEEFASAALAVGLGMIPDAIRCDNLGPLQKRALVARPLSMLRYSTVGAIRRTRSEDFVVWHLPHLLLPDLLRHGFSDLAAVVLNDSGEVLHEASKAGVLPYLALNEVATAGRAMAAEGNDTYAIMAAEVLASLAPLLEVHDSGPMRDMYLEAADGLRSIAEFDKREESETKRAVARLLPAFNLEEERKKQRELELPTRARLAAWPRWEAPPSSDISS